ncbi:hypothetical protein ABIF95_001187 [Bradyrhizobium ottawaense]
MEVGVELAPFADIARLDRLLETLVDVVEPVEIVSSEMRRRLREEARLQNAAQIEDVVDLVQ